MSIILLKILSVIELVSSTGCVLYAARSSVVAKEIELLNAKSDTYTKKLSNRTMATLLFAAASVVVSILLFLSIWLAT